MSLFYNTQSSISALARYQQEMEKHNPCPEGLEAFRECRSRKRAFELAVSPLAVDFFLRSMSEGWGPSPEEVETVFRPYINGGLTVRSDIGDRTISSQMWCGSEYVIVNDNVRWLVLVGCKGTVEIKRWQVVKILADASTDVHVTCDETSVVMVENYGGKITDSEGRARIINKI